MILLLLGFNFVSLSHLLVSCSIWIFSWFFSCFVWVIAYVWYCLSTLDYPECEACYYESLEVADHQEGKLHFDHSLLYPVLLCISSAPQIFALVGFGTCGSGCSAWGRNLIPIDHPGNICYDYLLLSHARRRGLDHDSHLEVWELFNHG